MDNILLNNQEHKIVRLNRTLSSHKNLRSYLLSEFDYKCAYCGTKLGENGLQPYLEHFVPKSILPETANEIENILISCPICCTIKGDRFPVDANGQPLLLNPRIDNYDDHIKISKSGEASALSEKGQVTIDTFNLNRVQLIQERKLRELEKEVIDAYKKVNNEYFENFKSALNTIRILNSFSQLAKDDIEKYLKNMLYSNAVTCLETFLADAFNSTLKSDKKFLRNFVEGFKDFNEDKFSLREVFQKYDTIENRVTEALFDMMWHNLAKVSGIYRDTFGIIFPPASTIFKAIIIRHDLVHRNGKSKTGKFHSIQNSDIENICTDIENFVVDIHKQIVALSTPMK
jgi:5-methylcytosine-specific restriction endonuclease McrA